MTTLKETVTAINKKMGARTLMQLSDDHPPVKVISTGSLALDLALGIGGIPRGRVTEIWGPEGAGKTTLAQHICAEAQKNDGVAVYIDMEHKVDPAYMAACGVDMNRLYFSQPMTGTAAFDIIKALVKGGAVDVIIVDSVHALSTGAEMDADAGDQFVGIQARLMSQNLKTIVPVLGLSKTALVFINQTRFKIGVMYGSPETTPGGVALKFYASIRMRISKIAMLGGRNKEYGIRSKVKIRKNNLAAPWKTAEFDIVWGEGISTAADILEAGIRTGVVSQGGGWYNLGDVRLGHGKEAAKIFLAQYLAHAETIRQEVLSGQA